MGKIQFAELYYFDRKYTSVQFVVQVIYGKPNFRNWNREEVTNIIGLIFFVDFAEISYKLVSWSEIIQNQVKKSKKIISKKSEFWKAYFSC